MPKGEGVLILLQQYLRLVLNDESPLAEVQPVVEVGDADFNAPVVLVVHLDMPVHTNGAHMVGAVEQRRT